jgi:hypothetical protein
MAIDTACPHCQTKYRLKDELAGKTVTCREAACRKVFAVVAAPPPANGAKPRKSADPPKPTVDAEELALQMFSEDPAAQAAVAERQVAVVCEICEHKWEEPASKVGKVVLCPECKHRQKIPEPKQKAADWREARKAGLKGPDLPEDLAAQQMQGISINTMKQAGMIEGPEIEPRTLKEKLGIAAMAATVLLAIGGGVWWFVTSRTAGQENLMMATAVDEIKELKDDGPLPKGQPSLMRATLHVAAGEYHAKLNTEESLKESLKHFRDARKDLASAAKSHERDVLFSELASAVLITGGDGEAVKGKSRIAWSSQSANNAQPGTGQTQFVQAELRVLLSAMLTAGVDPEMRFLTLRRLARELAAMGQSDLIVDMVPNGFVADEQQEAQAQALLEAARAGVPAEKLKIQATGVMTALSGSKLPFPPSALALFQKAGISADAVANKPPPPQGQAVSPATRLAYIPLYAIDKPQEAVNLATTNAGLSEMVAGLATVAEITPNPKDVLVAAATLVQAQKSELRVVNPVHLLRLTRAAVAAGDPAQADVFAQLVPDDGLREWAKAEALRAKWMAAKSTAPAGEAPKAEPGKLHVGNAWGCLLFARHNAAVTGTGDAKTYDGWGKGELRGFGYAGHALGLKDRK